MTLNKIKFDEELLKTADWSAGKYLGIDPHWLEHDRIINEVVPPLSNADVLDAGCGEGFHLRKLIERSNVKMAIGIDFSENMLKVAQKKIENAKRRGNFKLLKEDMRNLSLPDRNIDVAICMNNTLGLIVGKEINSALAERRKALKEIFRVLKKDGKLILTILDMNQFNINQYSETWILRDDISSPASGDFVLETKSTIKDKRLFFTHWFNKAEVKELSESVGFIENLYHKDKMQHIFVLRKQ